MGKVLIIKGANFSANAVAQIPYSEWELVNIDNLNVENAMIASTNRWTGGRGVFLPVEPGEQYRITAKSDKKAYYAPLTSNSHDNGTIPNWATGISGRIVINEGGSDTFTVPGDANYVFIAFGNTDDSVKPTIEIYSPF